MGSCNTNSCALRASSPKTVGRYVLAHTVGWSCGTYASNGECESCARTADSCLALALQSWSATRTCCLDGRRRPSFKFGQSPR
eukprot:5260545-Prorocentrum_lima.AAC.1